MLKQLSIGSLILASIVLGLGMIRGDDRYRGIENKSRVGGYAIAPRESIDRTIEDIVAASVSSSWRSASFPVENFQAYTSGFGYRTHPVTGKRQFHSGIDIAAPLGSTIRAWWGGEIVKLSDNTACGTAITIASGEWMHIYCHLKGHVKTNSSGTYLIDRSGGIILKLGQTIPTGTRIGRVGMTGRTTGPHLHWGLKYDGKYIDPALIIAEMHREPEYY